MANPTKQRPRIATPTLLWPRLAWLCAAALLVPAPGVRAEPATVTVLQSFTSRHDGASAVVTLVQARNGKFFGTYRTTDPILGAGAFRLTLDGKLKTVHIFDSLDRQGVNVGGMLLHGLVQGLGGDFYGTAYLGGAHGKGTVFRLTAGGTLTVLHAFSATDPTTHANADGSQPEPPLLQAADGNFYGLAWGGGANGGGTVFRLTPAGELTVLHDFDAPVRRGNNFFNTDGLYPHAALIQARDGNFYGLTHDGGRYAHGTAFRITPAGQWTVLHEFGPGDGAYSEGGLAEGSDGNFYGMTSIGGSGQNGTVFRLTPAGELTTVHVFGARDTPASGTNPDGAIPYSGLVLGRNGDFYGTTSGGGIYGGGTVFRLTPAGELTTIHSFGAYGSEDATREGGHPRSTLVQGADGNFYGTTDSDGPDGGGTIFSITPGLLLTGPASVTAGVGQPFRYRITATDGPTQFAASGLPAGLSVDPATGLIDGAATEPGTYRATVSARAANGDENTAPLTIIVLAAQALPTATLTATAPTVTLGSGGAGGFTVRLSAAQAADVSVHYTVEGSAANGTDYLPLTGTATIKEGKTSKTVKIRPQGGLDGASRKVVKLTLTVGNGYVVGTAEPQKIAILAPGR